MKSVFVDIHIHTSNNPNNINSNYDVDTLINKVKDISGDNEHLIGLSDHNTLNKSAYLRLLEVADNVILCSELHIRNYDDKPPYHCHIVLDLDVDEQNIDKINCKLDELYPNKVVTNEMSIPTLEKVVKKFDDIDFLLLPHGGQSHSTFDNSISDGVVFDTTLERSIYYNHFEGFTARSNNHIEQTMRYFKRLGIEGFVNLLTCTDNYDPKMYPVPKSSDAAEFIPTWMLSKPTFDGLRLSLSESDRFVYSKKPPIKWSEKIERVYIKNDKLDIDVQLTSGLNVVIGGSSSGKTLFVDSLYRKIVNQFDDSSYLEYGIEDITVINPPKLVPYYIYQNYIVEVINKSNNSNGIEDIGLIKQVFEGSEDEKNKLRAAISVLKCDLHLLIDQVKIIEEEKQRMSRVPTIVKLISKEYALNNLVGELLPEEDIVNRTSLDFDFFDNSVTFLDELMSIMNSNPFSTSGNEEIESLKMKLEEFKRKSDFDTEIRTILNKSKNEIDTFLTSANAEAQTKKKSYEGLIDSIKKYISAKKQFDITLQKIATYSYHSDSEKVVSEGHKLYIENSFLLNKEKFLEIINEFLKPNSKINDFGLITPERLFEANYKERPKVTGYDDFVSKVAHEFEKMNKRNYKIITKEDKNFDKLSAGWKTSVLLDLILGYKDDFAPLIIDQPEDNLATNYINDGLIKSIKNIKALKQIILVSHNATIPMLGDAQNVILCNNIDGKIVIKSAELEGKINGKTMVDYIAKITDGGKSSIKKRVKKYNLKKFKGEQ